MNSQAAQSYLKTKVLTATAEQLQLMLYDGAIRFAEQGRAALEKKDFQASHHALIRAQKIINELISGLRRDVYPELCGKLASLYTYAHRNLVGANTRHQVSMVDEALKVLRFQRDTWAMLLEKVGKTKAADAVRAGEAPPPDLRMESTLSIQG
jgi:flagellar secretion chaperone FliS